MLNIESYFKDILNKSFLYFIYLISSMSNRLFNFEKSMLTILSFSFKFDYDLIISFSIYIYRDFRSSNSLII